MVNDRQDESRSPVVPRVPLRWLERGLFTLGLLMIGLWFRNETEAGASHSAETKQLAAVRPGGGAADAPAPGLSREPWCPEKLASGVFGRIEIPRLGISALITEGDEPSKLERAVGHVSTTAFPGRPGNCALAGYRNGFLRGLENVRRNDVIRIDTLQGTYTYVVEWHGVVPPHRVDVLEAMEAPSLTLVSSDPHHAAGPVAKRFVVRAKLAVPATLAVR